MGYRISQEMDLMRKLEILADAARPVSVTASAVMDDAFLF